MKFVLALASLLLLVTAAHPAPALAQVKADTLRITEFMAANNSTRADEDGDYSDWIELYNPDTAPVSLRGWFLTDDAGNPTKWTFPDLSLGAGEYRVVFASGKDRGAPIAAWETVVRQGDTGRYRADTQGIPSDWINPGFNDTTWPAGPSGYGYGDDDDATEIARPVISVFVRFTFSVDQAADVLRALLHVDYDDAFVAYLNGVEVARSPGFGTPGVRPAFDFSPPTDHEAVLYEGQPPEAFEVEDAAALLVDGENVLAVEVHNISTGSSDLSLIPFLSLGLAAPPANPRGVAGVVAPLLTASSLHTNFSLSASGEYLALVMPDGVTVASAFAPAYPPQLPDVSYGVNGSTTGFFDPPTPGAPNGPLLTGRLEAPTFSVRRGFFNTPFKVTLATNEPGATIRYTVDGSTPTAGRGLRYSEAIAVTGTTVLRAAAFRDGYIDSDVNTQTYLFLDDILTQSANGSPPPGWPANWASNVVDYGMDPQVVGAQGSAARAGVLEALAAIPSLSIVTNLSNLFSDATGIYANASRHGIDWERTVSLELLDPDGLQEFQINAGLRIRGGYSRDRNNPKHAFRLFFRDPLLHYPLFGDEGPDTFENLDLRTSQNYSWAFDNSPRNIMNRDVFSRDLQRELGEPYTRSRYYHLYLNGQYWGLYQSQERSEASYGATYFGGHKSDYDVLKSTGNYIGFYDLEATDGNLEAWTLLWNLVNTLADAGDEATRQALYLQAQGLNPDGTRNPAYPVLLDVDNLIHYMMVIFYTGNRDAPLALDNNNVNNFYAVRNRNGDRGFAFFAHDSEHSLLDINDNRTGPFPAGHTFIESSPQWIHQQLTFSEDYRLRFADLTYRHFGTGGVLSPQRTRERFLSRAQEIEQAIIAESARWGDAKRAQPYTKQDWQNHINELTNNYFPVRTNIVMNQFRNARRYLAWRSPFQTTTVSAALYSNVTAPAFNQEGGTVPANFELVLSGTETLYYTLDGTDPRAPDGTPAPTAHAYDGTPVVLTGRTTVKSRAVKEAVWSPLHEATYFINSAPPTADNLALTELNYNPAAPTPEEAAAGFDDNNDFEFIELLNLDNTTALDLTGLAFTEGITFTFGARMLAPGERLVLARDEAAFRLRYGDSPQVAGSYDGRLNNAGEIVTLLVQAGGEVLRTFTYGTSGPWPGRADGGGSSLELLDPAASYDDPDNWRSSAEYGGTPGTPGTGPQPGVVINEVLAHTDPPQSDAIELFNPTAGPVDVGGWYLSDGYPYKKFALPAGTVLPAGGYLLFDEGDFNTKGDTTDFALNSAHGDEVWLLQTDAGGRLTRFVDHVDVGATFNGVSLGRWPNGTGVLYTMSALTLGTANSGPSVGPVVLREVMYHPLNDDDNLEYLEVYNAGDVAQGLTRWRIDDGVAFEFPDGYTLEPQAAVLLVSFDPLAAPDRVAVFREAYPFAAGVQLLGPWIGRLDNGGERVTMTRPDEPPVDEPDFYPAILADRVTYDDAAPWPDADGNGAALHRPAPLSFPEDPASWIALDRKSVSVEPPLEVTHYALSAVFPNPAQGLASVELVLEEPEPVRITVYDVLGRAVLSLYDGTPTALQMHRFRFDGTALSSGLYFVRVTGTSFQATRAVVVVR